MKQRIRLTWRNQNILTVEECDLLSEEDIGLTNVEDSVGSIVTYFANLGYVVFEDKVGMFYLPPEKIIRIEIL